MAPATVSLTAEFIGALERRMASGAVHHSDEVAAAAVARLQLWGARRAIAAADPLIDELGLPTALSDAGIEVLRWPTGRPWRELMGLDGPDDACGITVPVVAVAQRGTVVLAAGEGHGRSIDVVSRFHLPVLPSERILPTLAEALAVCFRERTPSSAVSLVSGPSRSSDIEKIATYGVHGALAEHVLIVDDSGTS